MTPAQVIAGRYRGEQSRTTYAPELIKGLMAFPRGGEDIRATVLMGHRVYARLVRDGLIAGPTSAAHILPLGRQVQALLQEERS